ncbi:hypothetical protein GWK47_041961 [Chionoecetes opilio]|uniref:Uncharacterized protein n=1 Tax=Chionoecetes opilio TaxID=41210 RepID=A0A8J4Y995_CHIOP|nr:hypothetical protein GWK47_041961 [Chionoecetes opilio]
MEGDHHHHQHRGRSPLCAPQTHSRDSSPNWSDISDHSDHSPPRILTPQPPQPLTLTPNPEFLPLETSKQGGRRSPLRGGAVRKRLNRHGGLSEETSSARLEVTCLVVQVLVAVTAMVQAVPLALLTAAWQHQGPRVCPLYVTRPPGFGIHWGNEDLAGCKAAAYLPILVACLAITLATAHACVLHVWRTAGHGPAASASKVYAGITMILVVLQVVVALTAVLVLTEGFRQTCISFDLSLSWNEAVQPCSKRLGERDAAYTISSTFGRIVAGLVGGWGCVVLSCVLLVVCAVRARLCTLQLLCV